MSKPTPEMRLIAHQGRGRYLIEVAPRADGVRMAQILDLTRGILFDPWLLASILARGYWEGYTRPQSRRKLAKLLDRL